jgi:hydrogenase maturation protease
MTAPVVVIGVGNPWRGDDGVGVAVAREVADRLRRLTATGPGAEPRAVVEVAEVDGEPARLLELWAGRDLAVVVDAVVSGAAPGTLHVGGPDLGPAPGRARVGGSHAVGIADAVALGRALGRLPTRLVTVGVEGAGFDHGGDLDLDPRVAAAVPEAADVVVTEVTAAAGVAAAGGGDGSCV